MDFRASCDGCHQRWNEMKEKTVIRTQASGTARLLDFPNAVLLRDNGMNDAHSRNTAKRCGGKLYLYGEIKRYAYFVKDSDVFALICE